MDTTNPRCLQLSPRLVSTCAVALKTIKNCAHCLINVSVVYQATVTIKDKTTKRPPQTYVGLTENSFKTRLANHKASFNSFDKRNATELSKYVMGIEKSKHPLYNQMETIETS